ncbi:hypothetical protein EDB85DRAFT_2153924 [Lactarius pseudohatsudake]|nr:hypothetical protein EDB85DRAFT_2153924 [Lactarius pseudohatsudake]
MCPIRVRRTVTPPPLLPVAPGPPLPSCPRRPVRAEGGTRGWPPPSLPHSRGRGAHEGTPPPLRIAPAPALFPFPLRATPFARKGAHEGTPPPAPPFPIRAEGCCTQVRRAAPYTREGGMRGHATPSPILPHSRGRAGARRHAAPFAREGAHEAKQGWRGLRAPAFTAPAPRFRVP